MILKWLDAKPEKQPGTWYHWIAWYPVVAADMGTGREALIWLEPCEYRFSLDDSAWADEHIEYEYRF